MSDRYLEREKQLMKLNESLNSKISFDLKIPKTKCKRPMTTSTKTPIKSPQNSLKKSASTEPTPIKSNQIDNLNGQIKIPNRTHNNKQQQQHQFETDELEWKANDVTIIANTQQQNSGIKNDEIEHNQKSTSKHSFNEIENGEKMMRSHLSVVPHNLIRQNTSSEGIIKFLKSKVTILQQELILSHQQNTKNGDTLTKVLEQQKKSEVARCQAANQVKLLNAQIQKFQRNETQLMDQLKESELLQQSHRKECDDLKTKLKAAQQSNLTYEHRLNKYQDDLDDLQKKVDAFRTREKDLKSSMQHERTFYENQLKVNQKQRNDLIAALKKHMLLLENLKRQNSCLTQAKCIQMTEMEFIKILNWNCNVGK